MNRGRPSPALVVACVALVVALGGTAIAAGIGRNSIGARELGKVVLRSNEKTIAGGAIEGARTKCRRGEQLLGGGALLPGADPLERPSVERSGPADSRTWRAVAANDDSTFEVTLLVTAICLKK